MREIVLVVSLCLAVASSTLLYGQESEVAVRYIRAYGADNELLPPVLLLNENSDPAQPGSAYATVEFDVRASHIPNVYVRLIHCKADWTEDDNLFLNDVTTRTSLVDWSIAAQRSTYFNYRGKVRIPNVQLSLRFAGNWKAVVYDMDTDQKLAETRMFVVDPRAQTMFNFMTDFYDPNARVSSTALTLEAIVSAPTTEIIDPNVHTCVFYRNNRWYEPFVVSTRSFHGRNSYNVGTAVTGVFPPGKVFRVLRIPAQNEYRILDLTNLALFPSTGQPVRLPLSDLRRNGMFLERSDDGALTSTMISSANNEYVPLEFLLDPSPGSPSEHDVFLVGSFNNWHPTRDWMMWFDEDLRMYRLRQWVRRGRHNYLYATGTLNVDTDEVDDLSFEEFEGNTASNSNSYIAFTYARILEYGGYDAIISVGSSNIYTGNR